MCWVLAGSNGYHGAYRTHAQDAAQVPAGRFGRGGRLAAALNGGYRADAPAVVNPCASHAAKSM